MRIEKSTLILVCFVILKFILQYTLISPDYDLHRDEYLHLDQAYYLAWGYQSVPPATSWISLAIHFFGKSEVIVKFFPALFGALTICMIWKAIEELGGNLTAQLVGASGVLFSVLLRLNTLYQPNSLDVLCWTALYFALIKYFSKNQNKWLYIAAIIFAIGFLNKYNIAFAVIGLVPALSLSLQRKIFTNPVLYKTLIVGALIILPNLIWQVNNDFPVVTHMRQLSALQLVNVSRVQFLESQLLFFGGSLLVIIAGLYAFISYPPFKRYQFFFGAFFFTLLIFIALRGKDYYAIGIYPIYIAFGATYLTKVFKKQWKKYIPWAFIITPILFFQYTLTFLYPNKSPEYIAAHPEVYEKFGMLTWEDGQTYQLPQDFADMLGWKELAEKVDKAYLASPDPSKTLILCDNYGQAGAINYYSKQGLRAYSFSADYIYWIDLSKPYDHFIRVKELEMDDDKLEETGQFFSKSTLVDSISNTFAREQGTKIYVFENASIDINQAIQEEIDEVLSFQ